MILRAFATIWCLLLGFCAAANAKDELDTLDQSAFLVSCLSTQMTSQPIWICSKCAWAYYYLPQQCPRCHSTDFIVRYR